jgi:fatty acid desaturase
MELPRPEAPPSFRPPTTRRRKRKSWVKSRRLWLAVFAGLAALIAALWYAQSLFSR